MAVDAFLKLDDLKGESIDAKHKDEIEVLSWSWGETNGPTSNPGAGLGSGKVAFQDFHFTSRLQRSSPKLFLACASGEHFKKAVLTMRKAGGSQQDFYKVTFEDVLVSSFQQAASSDSHESTALEQISLNFAKIEITYTVQNSKGTTGETVSASWDIKKNTGG